MKTLKLTVLAGAMTASLSAHAVFFFNTDGSIEGSLCVGIDCVANEAFGFDTLRLKENNLRIHFDDTSNSASFPSTDWRITVNDSNNGGLNKFSIDDATAGTIPFTIEGNAPSNSLYVDDGGRVGVGTSAPVVGIHHVSGNTPTLRLEQDGSSGFAAQTWDLAGNEANFFLRDVTNGSRLVFRAFPGALSDQLSLTSTGVGINDTSPEADFHVRGQTNENAELQFETVGGSAPGSWEIKRNKDTGRLTFFATDGAAVTASFKFDPAAVENLFRVGVVNGNTVDINGDLIISGNCTEQNGACADYVFEPDYELRSLDELAAFIEENRHLPNVPSADDMMKNGVNMTHISGRLLEKIEELTLYTLQQQETIEQLKAEMAGLKTQDAQLVPTTFAVDNSNDL